MPRSDTKARMVASAIGLLRSRGSAAVTIDAVLADSGAPRGSVYHHFPGGRDELLLTAGRVSADYITRLIDQVAAAGEPLQLLDRFVDFWKQSLAESDYEAGCPVVALALDHRDDLPAAATLARDTFRTWDEHLTRALVDAGRAPVDAAALATLMIASIEGAIILCRSRRSTEPLDQVAAQLRSLLVKTLG